MTTDVFTDNAVTTLGANVTTTPVSGTSETWTITSTGAPLPQITTGQQYRVVVGPTSDTTPEIVIVTAILSSTSLTVVRGMGSVANVKTHSAGDAFSHVIAAGVMNTAAATVSAISSGTPSNPVTSASATRPTNLPVVYWACATQPTNMAIGDYWDQVAAGPTAITVANTSSLWTGANGVVLSNSTGIEHGGVASLVMTAPVTPQATNGNAYLSTNQSCTAAVTYIFTAYLQASAAGRQGWVQLNWENSSGTFLSTSTGTTTTLTSGTFVALTITATAPSTAAQVTPVFFYSVTAATDLPASEPCYFSGS